MTSEREEALLVPPPPLKNKSLLSVSVQRPAPRLEGFTSKDRELAGFKRLAGNLGRGDCGDDSPPATGELAPDSEAAGDTAPAAVC